MTKNDRQFEMQLEIQAPKDAVWRALIDAKEIARWFAPTTQSDARVGGRIRWQWGEQHVWDHVIEVLEPGARLRTRYDSTVDDGSGGKRPLFVDFVLQGHGGSTTLRLVHSGFGPEAAFDHEFDGISGGWPGELRSLRLYLEHHRGRDRMLAWATHTTPLPADAAWRLLTGSNGILAGELPRLREGEPWQLDVPGAGKLAGTALFAPSPREFSGVVDNLDKGFFRIHCEHWGGATQVWLWLALYEGPPARVLPFQRAFDHVLEMVFAGADATAERNA